MSAVPSTRLGLLDQSEVLDIDPSDAVVLHTQARVLAGGRDTGALTQHGAALVSALAPRLLRRMHRFVATGSPHNTLLLRGVLPHLHDLRETPATATPPELGDAAQAAALTLLAVGSLLGEPFTFADLDEGRLVQHVVPVRGRETAQTSEGGVELAWRVRDAFSDDRCDYVGLLCLRGQPSAATMLAPARTLNLPNNITEVLRQDRFVIAPDLAHGIDPAASPLAPGPVLTGLYEDPEICFDAVLQQPADPGDGEAAEALEVLAAAIERAAIGHVLRPGELLILDNRRVVHRPAVFKPRYDGSDRWLECVMLCADRRAHRRRGGNRVLI